ncbi:MAG: hypothetical protein ACYC6G_13955 [Desulfobaccales bacterium]
MSTSKSPKRLDKPRQRSIFEELVLRQPKPQTTEGSMRCIDDLKVEMNLALKRCPLSRYEVAGRMSHLLNEEISKAQIDSWTADSKDRHIPAQYIPAFCEVTNYDGPLVVMNRKRRLHTFQEPDAIRAAIQQLREKQKEVSQEIRQAEGLLQLYDKKVKR